MTIICCLPSLPVEVFWHLLTPLQRYIPPTVRLETSRLNSLPSWVKSRAIEYAFTRTCFHAGEIRVLDSSLCTKLSCIGEARRFVGRSFNFQKRKRLDRCSVCVSNPDYRLLQARTSGPRSLRAALRLLVQVLIDARRRTPWHLSRMVSPEAAEHHRLIAPAAETANVMVFSAAS